MLVAAVVTAFDDHYHYSVAAMAMATATEMVMVMGQVIIKRYGRMFDDEWMVEVQKVDHYHAVLLPIPHTI